MLIGERVTDFNIGRKLQKITRMLVIQINNDRFGNKSPSNCFGRELMQTLKKLTFCLFIIFKTAMRLNMFWREIGKDSIVVTNPPVTILLNPLR